MCQALAREAQAAGQTEGEGLHRLDAEWDNCRAAVENALLQGRSTDAAQLVLTLQRFLTLRSYGQEVVPWLERALRDTTLPETLQAECRLALGAVAVEYQGIPAAQAHLGQARALLESCPNKHLAASTYFLEGRLAYLARDTKQAQKAHESALEIWQALENDEGCARVLHTLAQVAMHNQEWERARRLFTQADASAHRVGRPSLLVDILFDRARLDMFLGDHPTSLVRNEECLQQARALGLLGCTPKTVPPPALVFTFNRGGQSPLDERNKYESGRDERRADCRDFTGSR